RLRGEGRRLLQRRQRLDDPPTVLTAPGAAGFRGPFEELLDLRRAEPWLPGQDVGRDRGDEGAGRAGAAADHVLAPGDGAGDVHAGGGHAQVPGALGERRV